MSAKSSDDVVNYVDLRLHYKDEVVLHLRLISNTAADTIDRLITGRPSKGSAGPAGTSSHKRAPPTDPPVGASRRTAHEVLGVPGGADEATIRKAYIELVKQYHPDRVANLAPEIRELAGRRMREINAAFEVLEDRR